MTESPNFEEGGRYKLTDCRYGFLTHPILNNPHQLLTF